MTGAAGRLVVEIPVTDALPSPAAVLEGQGFPPGRAPDGRTAGLVRDAIARYGALASPAGILEEIDRIGFEAIYGGRDLHDDESPVGPIAERGDRLALFAVTVGEAVSVEIARLFAACDYAGGALLDSAASAGADLAAEALERIHHARLGAAGRIGAGRRTLRFSPGYCGWRVGAQRALFAALRPGAIGIALNDSCLMRPLKSVSGVLITGPREIFEFEDVFPFCAVCRTHECRDRIASLDRQGN